MKILHLITTTDLGGAEKQLLHLARSQIKHGYTVHVAYLKGSGTLNRDFESSGVRVHTELTSRCFFRQIFQLNRILKQIRPDVMHGHLPRSEILVALIPSTCPKIVSKHNSETFIPQKGFGYVSRILSRTVERRVSSIVCISNSVLQFLVSVGEISDSNKYHIVHYGITQKKLRNTAQNVQDLSYLKLGTISRLSPQKDLKTQIEGFTSYATEFQESTLSILGVGPLEKILKEYVQMFECGNRVNFLGQSKDIESFFKTIDVFVLSSKYEGFGLVLLEAMNEGVPILSSNSIAAIEVLGDNFPGFFSIGNVTEFKEKLIEIHSLDFRRRLVNLQEERLSLFSIEITFEKMHQIYELSIEYFLQRNSRSSS